MTILQLVTLLISQVHPDASKVGHAATFATSIAWTVNHDPLPVGFTKELSAAVLTLTAWEEGRFCIGCRRGDVSIHTNGSACTFQVRAFSEAHARQLEGDPISCTRAAYYVVREGARICPRDPLAPYAGGCSSKNAQEISRRRMKRAQEMVQATTNAP